MGDSNVAAALAKQTAHRNGLPDVDPTETQEWLEAFDSVLQFRGLARCDQIMQDLLAHARSRGVEISKLLNTPYGNTIPPARQPGYPGDLGLERKITAIVRWNALAMVVRANKESSELGGHLASYA